MFGSTQIAPTNGGPLVVHGIVFQEDDREVATLTRKVLLLARVFLILAVLEAVQDVLLNNTSETFVWLFVSLVTPYAGYYGAKNKDRNLLCMFYTVNLMLAVMYAGWILLMLLILSMVDTNVHKCDFCHSLDVPACSPTTLDSEACSHCRECHQRGMECGPPAVPYHSLNDNYERSVENEEENSLEHGRNDNYNSRSSKHRRQQPPACAAWEHLQANQLEVYFQILTCFLQVVLACMAFSSGKKLANHRYFLTPAAQQARVPSHERPPVRARTHAGPPTPTRILQASVVAVPSFEDERPALAPGEVMANAVTNPVAAPSSAVSDFQANDIIDSGLSTEGGSAPLPMATIVTAKPTDRR